MRAWLKKHLGGTTFSSVVVSSAISIIAGIKLDLNPVEAITKLGFPTAIAVAMAFAFVWVFTVHFPQIMKTFTETNTKLADSVNNLAGRVEHIEKRLEATGQFPRQQAEDDRPVREKKITRRNKLPEKD